VVGQEAVAAAGTVGIGAVAQVVVVRVVVRVAAAKVAAVRAVVGTVAGVRAVEKRRR